ncbi:MAG: hypothetical protein IJW54_07460 [Clostridia bacterium]|nr:hypothetical protein [Clostridia bacterium]
MDNQNNYQADIRPDNQNNYEKTPSSLITGLAGAGAVALAIGLIIFIVKTFSQTTNVQMVFNVLNQGCILAGAIMFVAYYAASYKKNSGDMLLVGAFALISIGAFVGVFNLIIALANQQGDFFKAFLAYLPQLSTPLITGILFMLVAKNFYTKNFSKITYSLALGFVVAACPQSVLSAVCGLMLSTAQDNSALFYLLLLSLGQALLYTAMLVFGVKEYYKSK